MKVKFKKFHPEAKIPFKAHTYDAGFDLSAVSRVFDDDHNVVYDTGIAVSIPNGFVGLLFPRSSNSKKQLLLSNSVGVIDSGFIGSITFKFKGSIGHLVGDQSIYEVGDRIGQLVIIEIPLIEFEEVEELEETERGTGSYGSTGK